MSNDNGYFKKFKVIGIAVPSEKIVEVMNIIAGNDAVLVTNSVSFGYLLSHHGKVHSFVVVILCKT